MKRLQKTPNGPSGTGTKIARMLELVRLGQVELHQSLAFGPLLVRRRKGDHSPTEN